MINNALYELTPYSLKFKKYFVSKHVEPNLTLPNLV